MGCCQKHESQCVEAHASSYWMQNTCTIQCPIQYILTPYRAQGIHMCYRTQGTRTRPSRPTGHKMYTCALPDCIIHAGYTQALPDARHEQMLQDARYTHACHASYQAQDIPTRSHWMQNTCTIYTQALQDARHTHASVYRMQIHAGHSHALTDARNTHASHAYTGRKIYTHESNRTQNTCRIRSRPAGPETKAYTRVPRVPPDARCTHTRPTGRKIQAGYTNIPYRTHYTYDRPTGCSRYSPPAEHKIKCTLVLPDAGYPHHASCEAQDIHRSYRKGKTDT